VNKGPDAAVASSARITAYPEVNEGPTNFRMAGTRKLADQAMQARFSLLTYAYVFRELLNALSAFFNAASI
jgi:hypothetical protein